MRRLLLAALLLSAGCAPALANDTTAVLGTGGLIFITTDELKMQSEDLFISPTQVKVTYEFQNLTDKPLDVLVAFPMPDGSTKDRSGEIIANFKKLGLDAVIGIGGDGSFAILRKLAQQGGIRMVGVPKTIDNDIGETETALAAEIANLPDIVRGYEDVKLRNVATYREKLTLLRDRFTAEHKKQAP